MISLAGRDILHGWGKFVLTGFGLGLLIGVTLTMGGVYRGMVDDARVLLDNSGADLWVVQQDTLGPYAESSSIYDDLWRSVAGMKGVEAAANVTYLTTQIRRGRRTSGPWWWGSNPGSSAGRGSPGILWREGISPGVITRRWRTRHPDSASATPSEYAEIPTGLWGSPGEWSPREETQWSSSP